ncbi:flagellar hook-length control protein FliK [Alkalihalobacillus oceani]|uniref:flagellar hook-length control protein FliK n=1 Tax=Halalkalibacter oceani TaxID=1653776 RepID=UPI00203A6679|nr:flagellar hook-length control protein FliK [Halalkalibacter oceani]MCM3759451.1 flagellar hook-length control protein FliK [Halalkalibacter oceani]
MNPIMMLAHAAPAQGSASSAKGQASMSADASFLQLLGGLLSEDTVKTLATEISSEEQEQAATELLLELIQLFKESGLELNPDMLEGKEAKQLFHLLPIEWQADVEHLLSLENEDAQLAELISWPEEQQALFVLLAAVRQESASNAIPVKSEQQATILQLLLTKLFPGFSSQAKQGQSSFVLVDEVVKHLEGKLPVSMQTTGVEPRAFLEAVTAKSTSTLQLPQAFSMPVATEATTSPFTPQQRFGQLSASEASGSNSGLTLTQTGNEQTMTRAEQATIHIGDKLPRDVQQQQFLRQFQMILQRGALTQNQQGMQTFSVKLYPEHLGRLDIQLVQMEGTIVAKIMTGSTATRELIEAQLAQLRQAFAQQQISVERIEVTEQQLQKERDESSNKREEEQANENQPEQGEDEAAAFEDVLSELTFNEQV